ncbi:MAG: ABC transporter ATP-binding protein [Woeseiaceae bacterium]|nr:ABC transporter ATP-binding protein [Woeseiaceae bacterium]
MIELVNLSKRYPTKEGVRHVLRDVTLTIPTDKSVGVLGRNGAGKSTLLRLIAGIEAPDSGKVMRHSRVSWPIGLTGGFHGFLTGEENLRFVSRVYGADPVDVANKVREFAELGEYFHMPLRTYSSGMRARLAFGLSMAIDFDVYLIDEIIAVGDSVFREKCRESLQARRDHSSVIIVSHNLATIRQYADLCAVLREGRLRLFESVDEAARVYQAA